MKRIKLIVVLLIFTVAFVLSQQTPDDLQKVKDALINEVLYSQELEKQNANLNKTIQKIAEDLKNITTAEQLDSLKVVYGIQEKKLNYESTNEKR